VLECKEENRSSSDVVPVVVDPYISRQLNRISVKGYPSMAFLWVKTGLSDGEGAERLCMAILVDPNLKGAVLADEMGLDS
jgi:hypothetical protein